MMIIHLTQQKNNPLCRSHCCLSSTRISEHIKDSRWLISLNCPPYCRWSIFCEMLLLRFCFKLYISYAHFHTYINLPPSLHTEYVSPPHHETTNGWKIRSRRDTEEEITRVPGTGPEFTHSICPQEFRRECAVTIPLTSQDDLLSVQDGTVWLSYCGHHSALQIKLCKSL